MINFNQYPTERYPFLLTDPSSYHMIVEAIKFLLHLARVFPES